MVDRRGRGIGCQPQQPGTGFVDWSSARHYESDIEKAHGRVEKRRCWVLDITGPEWDGYCALYGRRQAIRIEREVYTVKSETTTTEITHCLTSLGAERASPEDLLALVRNHWHIENRLHYVRDFTYDEDWCRVRVRNLPRILACLTNAGILDRALQGRLQVSARGQSLLCRAYSGSPRQHHQPVR